MPEFREIIRAERDKKGLSRNQLAKLVGCSEMGIYFWESGRREITLQMADRILKEIGATMVIGVSKEE